VTVNVATPKTKLGDPTWEIALLFPAQGAWTEDDYFALEGGDTRLKELSNGCLELLPMPNAQHQRLLKFLFKAVEQYLEESGVGGEVFFAPLPVRLWQGTVREPDLVYLSESRSRKMVKYPHGADLVMEIMSESAEDRQHDSVTKRKDYSRAGISEYWIVDPQQIKVTVLLLNRKTKKYQELASAGRGQVARSGYLNGFQVAVSELFTPASRS